jgi:hypothetical protein
VEAEEKKEKTESVPPNGMYNIHMNRPCNRAMAAAATAIAVEEVTVNRSTRWQRFAVVGEGTRSARVPLCTRTNRGFKLDLSIPTDTSIRRTVAAVWRFSAKSIFVYITVLLIFFFVVVYDPI